VIVRTVTACSDVQVCTEFTLFGRDRPNVNYMFGHICPNRGFLFIAFRIAILLFSAIVRQKKLLCLVFNDRTFCFCLGTYCRQRLCLAVWLRTVSKCTFALILLRVWFSSTTEENWFVHKLFKLITEHISVNWNCTPVIITAKQIWIHLHTFLLKWIPFFSNWKSFLVPFIWNWGY